MAIPRITSVGDKPKAAGTDPELLLMGQLDRKLKAADPEMRKRVVLWLHARHCGLDTTALPPAWLHQRHCKKIQATDNGDDGSIPFGGQ